LKLVSAKPMRRRAAKVFVLQEMETSEGLRAQFHGSDLELTKEAANVQG
jgi:hypothetical protein